MMILKCNKTYYLLSITFDGITTFILIFYHGWPYLATILKVQYLLNIPSTFVFRYNNIKIFILNYRYNNNKSTAF